MNNPQIERLAYWLWQQRGRHGSQFNVCIGAVLRGPAADALKTYRVVVDGEIGQVEDGE